MKKYLGVIFTTVLLVGLLAACGPKDDKSNDKGNTNASNGNENADMPEKPDNLLLWVNAEEKQEDALEVITDKYTEETGIDVKLVPVDMIEQVEKLDLEGPSGNGPDVIFQPHDRLGDLIIRGLVEPVNLDSVKDDYTDTALEAMQYDDAYWGYPAVIETYAMYYNKALVDEAPETMEDIMEIAASDTDAKNNEFGFLMEAANFYFVYPFFSGYGGYAFENNDGNYDISDIGLANEGSIKGGELVQSWYENDYIPQDLTPDIMNGLFAEGKVSTILNGPWMVREYHDALGDDLGVIPLPLLENGEHPKSFVGVKSYMLSYYSDHPEWSEDLMAFITNKENAMTYYEMAGEIPPRDDAMNDPIISEDEIFSAFAEQTKYGEPMPSVPAMQQVWDPINDALNFLSKGEPVDEVLQEAVEMISENIEASGASQ